ncbi:Lipid III flippase [compost metagenome]
MQIVKKILGQPLFKISSLNAVSVLVRIVGGLISSKVIAVFLGPGGIAIVGNLRNFLTSIEAFSTLGLQNGIVKYTAENEKDNDKLYKILGTVFCTLLCTVLLISFLLLVLSNYWSKWVFSEFGTYAWVFKVLAFTLPWYAGSLVFMAVLNGLGNYRQIIALNVFGNILGVIFSTLLIWKFHLNGALLGLVLFQAIFFVFSFYILQKKFPKIVFFRVQYFDLKIFKGLFSYSMMSLVTAILGPIIFMAIRKNLAKNFSPDEAGFWESMNRISGFYLMFATTMLTMHFLPKLSKAISKQETKAVFKSYYKSIVPLFAAGLIVVYFLREFIIRLLFTREFMPMTDLFFWQLLGDFFKVCSLILGYQFFAKKLTKVFIATEISSFIVLYISSTLLIKAYGSEGAVMAHAITYFIYTSVLGIYFKNIIFSSKHAV